MIEMYKSSAVGHHTRFKVRDKSVKYSKMVVMLALSGKTVHSGTCNSGWKIKTREGKKLG